MTLYLRSFRELLTQLVNLNNRGSATVSFVLAVPLMLILAFASLQLVFILIIQSQMNQITTLTARAMEFKEHHELQGYAKELINSQSVTISSYQLEIATSNEVSAPKTIIKLEVPVNNWIGINFNLSSIAYAP